MLRTMETRRITSARCVRERKAILKVTGVCFSPHAVSAVWTHRDVRKRNGTMATDTKALYLRADTRFKDADSFFFCLKCSTHLVNSPGMAPQPGTSAELWVGQKHGLEINFSNLINLIPQNLHMPIIFPAVLGKENKRRDPSLHRRRGERKS